MSLNLAASGEELRQQFLALRNREDVAKLLDIDDSRLIYHLYIASLSKRYTTFRIPKKSGGNRDITAPATALKIIQQKLNQVLQYVYQPKASVHGFICERNIVTNAERHKKQRYILNLDLKDFFPSINFGRVRGMFMAKPYSLPPEVATVLAQICCFNNQLPQGAPTSPIVSNMICAKMDAQLLRLAEKHRCIYTRYADDLSFSTSMREFPSALAKLSRITGQLELGDELKRVIGENHFKINFNKVRLQARNRRQEVTGLTVNRFPNVVRRYKNQIRAMLHAWKKYGIKAAEQEFRGRYDKKHRGPGKDKPMFKYVIKGKIDFLGMVRGKADASYLRFLNQWRSLAKEGHTVVTDAGRKLAGPLIMTEGKTDWKHLKAALQSLKDSGSFERLEIDFNETENPRGGDKLLQMCESYSEMDHGRPIIFVFDRDTPHIVEKVSGDEGYKHWNNAVFSLTIPVPDHRQDTPEVCIELYYKDADLKRSDQFGRRLYLSNEFDPVTGYHKSEDLIIRDPKKAEASHQRISVIEIPVIHRERKNVALSKSDFADYILNRDKDFRDLDVTDFRRIFEVISKIIEKTSHT